MSKPNKLACRAQVGRLQVFDSTFPKTAIGVSGLADTLWSVSMSEDHAKRIIGYLIDTCKFCPVPADFHSAMAAVPSREKIPVGCEQCDGSGWEPVKNGTITDPDTGKQLIADGYRRCSCPKGRYMLAKQKEHEQRAGR
jgi:hypothetical protein